MTSTVGRVSQLDKATLMRLQAGCNYINAEVEKCRRRVVNVAIIAGVLAVVLYAYLVRSGTTKDPRFPFATAAAVALGYGARTRRQIAHSFKHIVVRRVVTALGHGLSYSPESRFTKQDFLDMDLFQKRAEKWNAEDEITGRKNDVTYSILEAKATRTEGSGKHKRTVIIFDGVIVRLDFNKHFAGHTIVVPDNDSKLLGGLLGESESRRQKELVRLENVDFEDQFSVYSTDQQEARYLLTPKLMELVMEAKALLGSDLRLSFHDNSVFLTIPQQQNRFEVSLFGGKVTPEATVGELAEVVKLAERLVDTLQLETRIWSRV